MDDHDLLMPLAGGGCGGSPGLERSRRRARAPAGHSANAHCAAQYWR